MYSIRADESIQYPYFYGKLLLSRGIEMEEKRIKADRQKLILELISKQPVETQQQLRELLEENGVHCTQATLSRDLRTLGLVKQAEPGGLVRYSLSPHAGDENEIGRLLNIARISVHSVDVAQNIIVIKAMPGLGKAVGSFADHLDQDGLVGSIAGNDTILLIMRDNTAANELLQVIRDLLSGARTLP